MLANQQWHDDIGGKGVVETLALPEAHGSVFRFPSLAVPAFHRRGHPTSITITRLQPSEEYSIVGHAFHQREQHRKGVFIS